MSNLSDIWKIKRRGQRDSARHKELLKEAIKKNSKEIITQYDLITTDGDKKIKIPIRFLENYKFKHGSNKKNSGIGQGLNGKKGTKYKYSDGKKKDKDGKPGEESGEHHYEDEISLDEMVDILLEELKLPWMKPTEEFKIETENEVFNSIQKKGLMPNIDIKRTLINNMKRNIALNNEKLIGGFSNDDLRYKDWDNEKEYHSNANVYMMMDVSGSMTKERRDVAKLYYFWMVQFLRRKYKKVNLFFITHDVKASFVSQENFFKVNSNGGTKCSSAFALAYDHIKKNYNSEKFNNYVFEFSDGDNIKSDNLLCIEIVNNLLSLCRAIGYGEISDPEYPMWLKEDEILSNMFNNNIKRTRFVSLSFEDKNDIFKNLKKFFNIEGISKKVEV